MIKLASHNSWTYMRPERRWMNIFLPSSRCQNIGIKNQYDIGVRMFDMRLYPSDDGTLKLAHGMVKFNVDHDNLRSELRYLDGKSTASDKVYIRVLMEKRKPNVGDILQFVNTCRLLSRKYAQISFFGGHGAHRDNWKKTYFSFGTEIPRYTEKHASVCGIFPDKYIPSRWAFKNNSDVINSLSEYDDLFVMLDFVQI